MKKAAINALHMLVTCLFFSSTSAADDVKITALLTTGERSKDTSSQTVTIRVDAKGILWETEASGSGRHAAPTPTREHFQITAIERLSLIKLIRENGLLLSNSISVPLPTPAFYFEIDINIHLDTERSSIHIRGPRPTSELRHNQIYRSSMLLLNELQRIVHAQNSNIGFEDPLLSTN